MCDCSAQISKCYLQTSLFVLYNLQLFITVKLKLKLTFYFVVKCLISICKFCDSSNLLFFFFDELSICRNQHQLLLFPCNPIGQPCPSGPGYSSRTVIVNIILRIYLMKQWIIQLPVHK